MKAASDRDKLITFWGERVKGIGHSMTKFAKIESFSGFLKFHRIIFFCVMKLVCWFWATE